MHKSLMFGGIALFFLLGLLGCQSTGIAKRGDDGGAGNGVSQGGASDAAVVQGGSTGTGDLGGTAGLGGSASQGGTGGGAGGGGGTNAGGATATGGGGGQAGALGGVGSSGSGGGAGGTGGSGGSTGASLVTLANAFCATARSCCAKSGISASLGDCETMFPSRLHTLAFVNKGTVKIDSTALAACIAAYNQTATTCAYHSLVTACRGVFVGTKAENEPCGVGGSNASGVYECQKSDGPEKCTWTGDPSSPAVTGVCHRLVHGKNGDPCDSSCASGEECSVDTFGSSSLTLAMCFEDDGLYCGFGASGDACAPIVAQGESCVADYPAGPFSVLGSCASTSYCDPVALECKAAGTIGQSCSSFDSACLRGLTCAEDGKCADLGFASWFTCEGEPPAP